jgi:hypothetical protein
MKNSRFRLSFTDTVKATVASAQTGKFLASIYDSGFTTIKQVESALLSKVPHFGGKKVNVSITNLDKEQSKSYELNVN